MYVIASYEKLKRLSIPLDKEHLLFVSVYNTNEEFKEYQDLSDADDLLSIIV